MTIALSCVPQFFLFEFFDLFDIGYLEKHATILSHKYLGPICKWVTSFFSFLDPTIGEFYRGPLGGLKYFVTFILIWVFGILLWIYSFKCIRSDLATAGDVEGWFPIFLFFFSWALRIACALGLVQFGLEITIAHYGDKIVNNTCYVDEVEGMTLFDSSTWPFWALILTVILLLRFILTLVFDTILLRPLEIFSFIFHIFCFLSIGWLLAHIVYVLDLIYQNMTLATALFGIIAQGISAVIRSVIPFCAELFVVMILFGFMVLILSPFIFLFSWIFSSIGDGGPVVSSSSSGTSEHLVTTTTYRHGIEVFSETRKASILEEIFEFDNPFHSLLWFLG